MALSTLPAPPPSLTAQLSAAAAASSAPNLFHSTAIFSFPSAQLNPIPNSYSTALTPARYKWRTHVSFFTDFLKNNKKKSAKEIKEELFKAIEPLDRGAEATPEDMEIVEQIVSKLEAANPTKEPLKSGLLDGKWELIYTTSQSILQTKRPKFLRSKVNYQAINVDTLRAQNMETGPFFNQVTADLTPVNPKKVAVKFDYFKLGGLVPVKAPDRARGALEITYLDDELRISRGDKGNLFILKMVDPSYRIPS
ncbi:putative plastid-lipid-associated protein 4, chloroplastic [Primulina tabacum]|uniref:putative plastid-lipid-associated protein 4, chloroplastic n=1 Tax=Primulina tabacum TaxID=48773 RepID=UPI003F59B47B